MPALEALLQHVEARPRASELERRRDPREDEVYPGKETLAEIEASTGTPLETGLRRELEMALGEDLTDVRVHATPAAARAARRLAARAFTIGRNVYFGAGAPDRLLFAHEVAHTVQQRGVAATGALEVSRPGDTHEREAESFAESFARGTGGPARLSGARAAIQRDVDPEALAERRHKWAAMLAWAEDRSRRTSVQRTELDALIAGSRAQQLPAELRADLAERLGNVDDVRIHTDAAADAAARSLDAEAFTVGRDIYFATGKYDPSSASGRHLIAHETAHAAQHEGSLHGSHLALSSPDDAHEMQADDFADTFIAAGPRPQPRIVAPDHRAAPRLIAPVRFAGISRRGPYGTPGPFGGLPSLPSRASLSQIDVPDVMLFPVDTWRKDFPIIDKSVPLAKGILPVGGIPVTYDAGLKLNASSFVTAGYGPAMLENLKVQLSEAERAAIAIAPDRQVIEIPVIPVLGPLSPSIGIGPNYEEEVKKHILSSDHSVSGTARISAFAGAGIGASATAEGSVHALDMFGGGVFAGIGGSVTADAKASASASLAATYRSGKVTVTSLTLGADFEFQWKAKLNAHAGFFVEVKLPTIPFVTDFVDEVSSWPVIGWVVPKWSDIKWRKDFRKDWKLLDKGASHKWKKEWQVIASGTSPTASHPMSLPDETAYDFASMVKDLTSGQNPDQDVPAEDEGPGKDVKDGASTAAVAGTRHSAKAQVKSARENIKRERAWNKKEIAKALVKIKKQKAAAAKTKGAGGGGSGRGAPSLSIKSASSGRGGGPGGGGDDKVPAEEHKEKLEARDEKLENADTGAQNLDKRVEQVQSQAEHKPDGVHRTRAQEGYQNVADNADKLGQAVGGYGDKKEEFERPVEPPDPGAAGGPSAEDLAEAEKARLEARKVLDELKEKIDTELGRLDAQWRATEGHPDLAGYRAQIDSHRSDIRSHHRGPRDALDTKHASVPDRHAENPKAQTEEYRTVIIPDAQKIEKAFDAHKAKEPKLPTDKVDKAYAAAKENYDWLDKTVNGGISWATTELREVDAQTKSAAAEMKGPLGRHKNKVENYQRQLGGFAEEVKRIKGVFESAQSAKDDLELRTEVLAEFKQVVDSVTELRPQLDAITRPVRPTTTEEENPEEFNMTFQVQWGQAGGKKGVTFSSQAIGRGTKGVTVAQAVAGLNDAHSKVVPAHAKEAAVPARDKQIEFVRGRPAVGGYSTQGSRSEDFHLAGETDARVDIENHRGHNLRE